MEQELVFMISMKKRLFKFKSEVWVYPGQSAWRFASVDRKLSERIKSDFGAVSKGWGSLPVSAKIGKTNWKTSIFPDKKSGEYLLPIKASVRKAEGVFDRDVVSLSIDILV